MAKELTAVKNFADEIDKAIKAEKDALDELAEYERHIDDVRTKRQHDNLAKLHAVQLQNLDELATFEEQREADYQQKMEAGRKALIKRLMRDGKSLKDAEAEADARYTKNKDTGAYETDEVSSVKSGQNKLDRAKEDKQLLASIKELKEAQQKGTIEQDEYIALLKEHGVTQKEANALLQKDIEEQRKGRLATAALNAGIQMSNQIAKQAQELSKKQGAIDTRLQGSKNATSWYDLNSTSYYGKIQQDMKLNLTGNPFLKQETMMGNVEKLVDQGVAYDLEERAFLMTISDKIATTFDATESSLMRLVRIQQQDSTAARLGMESSLNTFLNNMYETTEYMKDVMDTIQSGLVEAESLMDTQAAAELEYQVNKWLGSMYSVGMSQSGVQSIGQALSDLAAGKVSSISSGGAGNLLVMAANNAGLSIADALSDGLNGEETNKLMNAMVSYLKGIYNDTKDSKVVAQQYAAVLGLTASDIKAMANLSTTDLENVSKSNLSYSGMLGQLSSMTSSMYKRTSMGEMTSNVWDNLTYSTAQNIAANPALLLATYASDLLKNTVGGIEFSIPMYMGTGSAQTFNIADLMNVATVGTALLGTTGEAIASLGNLNTNNLLKSFGVGAGTSIARGTGSAGGLITNSGGAVSNSGYVGNSSSGDIYDSTMSAKSDETKAATAEAAEENNEKTMTDVYDEVSLLYDLILDVTNGNKSFTVKMDEDLGSFTKGLVNGLL